MKALIIENKKAYYKKSKDKAFEKEIITNITSEDIKNIIMYIMENEDIELCDTENIEINNKAEEIIYIHLAKKVNELIEEKTQIVKSVEDEYIQFISKYKED